MNLSVSSFRCCWLLCLSWSICGGQAALGQEVVIAPPTPESSASVPTEKSQVETVPVQSEPALTLLPGREADQIWLIDARQLGCGFSCDRLSVMRSVGCGYWNVSSIREFLAAADASMPTVFFVHGNRVASSEAYPESLDVYRALAQQMPEGLPLRLVYWSWPSAQIAGPLKDARIKAGRTDLSGYCLASVLREMPAESPVSLFGYSFGARITTGALHLLGGGRLGRYALETAASERVPMRVVLMAAAMHSDWLLPGRYHGEALTQTSQLLSIYNPADSALKHYHLISGSRGVQALGFTGIGGHWRLGHAQQKIEQYNAACIVGRSHSLYNYLDSPQLMGWAWHVLESGVGR